MARVRLLESQDVAGEHRAFVDGLDSTGNLINLYRALAHSPLTLRRFYDLVAAIWTGALTDRDREVAILSVVAESHADYPLGWHIGDAADAGLTPEEIRGVVDGNATAALPPRDAAIAAFARELAADVNAADATYAAVAAFMDEQQIVELTVLAGLYRLVATVANTLRVDLDEVPARAIERFEAAKPPRA